MQAHTVFLKALQVNMWNYILQICALILTQDNYNKSIFFFFFTFIIKQQILSWKFNDSMRLMIRNSTQCLEKWKVFFCTGTLKFRGKFIFKKYLCLIWLRVNDCPFSATLCCQKSSVRTFRDLWELLKCSMKVGFLEPSSWPITPNPGTSVFWSRFKTQETS